MIGTIDISLTASAPSRALPPVAILAGSAATFKIEGVTDALLRGLALTSVAVMVMTPDGVCTAANAVNRGGEWLATFDACHFGAFGNVAGGLSVSVVGTDELGRARQWIVGAADLEILPAEPFAVAGESWQCVRMVDGEAAAPHKGDLVNVDGHWRLYDGAAWVGIATAEDAKDAAAYSVADVTPDGAGASVQFADRCINELAVVQDGAGAVNVASVVMPPALDGRARDFLVRFDLTAMDEPPPIAIYGADSFESVDGLFPEVPAGQLTLVSFTETTAGVFAVAARRLVEVHDDD